MQKILVTGGLGFIGSNLIDLLIKKGFFVINIDKVGYASNFYNTINFKGKRNYKFFKLDINNKNIAKISFSMIFSRKKKIENKRAIISSI